MEKIQEKFKTMLQTLDLTNLEITDMYNGIDYKSNNQYKQIEDGIEISEKINSTKNIDKQNIVNVGGYTVQIGENGIKDNLYASLFTLLEDEKFNLLFENTQDNNSFDKNENILLKIHRQISDAKTDEEYIEIYDKIYELFKEKIDKNLNLNQSIDTLFSRYSNHIVELQKNAAFNEDTKKYLPSLESVINLYNKKVMDFEKIVDETTTKKLELEISRDDCNIEAEKKWHEKFSNKFKIELFGNLEQIDRQRLEQNERKVSKDAILEKNEEILLDENKAKEQEPYININGEIIRPGAEKTEKLTQELGKETWDEQKDTTSKKEIKLDLEKQKKIIRETQDKNIQSLN